MQLDFGGVMGGTEERLHMCPVSLFAIKRIFSNFTYGCLVMQLRFSETVILTLYLEGKNKFSKLSVSITVLFTKFLRFGSSSTGCHLIGKDLQMRIGFCACVRAINY